jgi:hypothetical protein
MNRRIIAGVLAAAAVTVAGCSKNDSSMQSNVSVTSTISTPVIAAPVSPAPSQVNEGRQPVQFDPCMRIGDDTITQAGYSPSTRERIDQIHDNYSFIGCRFQKGAQTGSATAGTGWLTILSTNVTLDELKKREGSNAIQTSVNGHDAVRYSDSADEACYMVVSAGPDKALSIKVSSAAEQGSASDTPCSQVQAAASIIVGSVDKK